MSERSPPGDRGGGLGRTSEDHPERQGEEDDADDEDRVRDDPVQCPFRPIARNWTEVSTITPSINTTDCAEDEPRSRLITPSRYTFTSKVSVALPGPPCVRAQMAPNVSKAA